MKGALPVRGWDPTLGCSIDSIMQALLGTGCQASTLGQAVQEVNRMVSCGCDYARRATSCCCWRSEQ